MITNHGKGNPELVNLPRKINIGLATTRDDFAHTHINDVGLYAARNPDNGQVRCYTAATSTLYGVGTPCQCVLHRPLVSVAKEEECI